MSFAKDRDLLALEPILFRDITWASQRLVTGTATIAAGVLTFDEIDADCETAGVTAGGVVLIGTTPYEILEVLGPDELAISILRPSETGDPLLMPDGAIATSTTIYTFAPQLEIIHRQVLRMLGIEPGATDTPTESDITNPAAIRRLESLGALHLIYSAAGALTAANSPLNARAELYRQRFNEERQRISIGLDLNADGQPDVVRKLNVVQFVRG
jgi:hypothetical protein